MSWRCCIPNDAAIEAAATKRGKNKDEEDHRKKPAESQAYWLGACYFAVDRAMRERNQDERFAA